MNLDVIWPGLTTIVGLCIALAGPALLAGPAERLLGDPASRSTHFKNQLAMWALLGLTLAIIIFAERRSLASIGLHAPTWHTVGFGIGAAAFIAATGPVIFPLLARSSADYSARLAMIEGWPLGLILFAALTSGVEEVLYRGYAIERLKEITGSYLLAAGVALAIFGLVHVPFWGRGPLLWFIYAGGVFTLVYLWTHDLAACILAHILSNLKALVVDPFVRRRVAFRMKKNEQEA